LLPVFRQIGLQRNASGQPRLLLLLLLLLLLMEVAVVCVFLSMFRQVLLHLLPPQ
jgi:hypothetical protein